MLKIILPFFLLQKYDMYDNDAYFFTKLYLKNVLNFVMIYSVTNSFFFSILVSSEIFNNYLVSNDCLFYDYFFYQVVPEKCFEFRHELFCFFF